MMMKTVLRLFFAIARYMPRSRYQNCTLRRLGDRGRVRHLEELALLEAQATHEQRVREDLDLRVQLAHAAVVEPARGLDLVLGVDQLALQLQVVLAGLELRVRLGDREDALQRRLHVVLGDGRLGRAARRQRLGSRLGDVLEDRLLVCRVSLDRLDEVRDEVGTTLELHGDVAPRLVHADVQRHERVVRRPQVDTDDDDEQDDDADDDEPFHGDDYSRAASACLSQSYELFGVRANVSKSTCTNPKRWRKP